MAHPSTIDDSRGSPPQSQFRTSHPWRTPQRVRATTMRNHPRIRHADAKGVRALFDIARIDAGGRDANTNFTSRRNRVRHLADHQYFARRPLFFVPSSFQSGSSRLRLVPVGHPFSE